MPAPESAPFTVSVPPVASSVPRIRYGAGQGAAATQRGAGIDRNRGDGQRAGADHIGAAELQRAGAADGVVERAAGGQIQHRAGGGGENAEARERPDRVSLPPVAVMVPLSTIPPMTDPKPDSVAPAATVTVPMPTDWPASV